MMSVITTVTAPAASYNLTDLATVKDELGIPVTDTSKDAFLTRALTQESRSIANYCNRVFASEGLTDTFYLPPVWSHHQRQPSAATLQLTRWPVTAVSSVTEIDANNVSTVLVLNTDYIRNDAVGQLIRIASDTLLPIRWQTHKIAVAYTAGYTTIPDDLVQVALRMTTARNSARARDPSLMGRDLPGAGNERYWVGARPGQDGAFPPEIAGILNNYRIPVIGG